MKLLVAIAIILCLDVNGFPQASWDDGWRWIVLLKTKQAEIEKAFGESITKDRKNLSQTYVTDFGKITVRYARESRPNEKRYCTIEAGTVQDIFISLRPKLRLSGIPLDLGAFKKDVTHGPREITYFNDRTGILLVTEIETSGGKVEIERVAYIEYHPAQTHGKAVCSQNSGEGMKDAIRNKLETVPADLLNASHSPCRCWLGCVGR